MSLITVPSPNLPIGSDHHLMLVLGFGTAAPPPPEQLLLKQTVLDAIKLGYRHFDRSPRYLKSEAFLSARFDLDPNSLLLPNFKLS